MINDETCSVNFCGLHEHFEFYNSFVIDRLWSNGPAESTKDLPDFLNYLLFI